MIRVHITVDQANGNMEEVASAGFHRTPFVLPNIETKPAEYEETVDVP